MLITLDSGLKPWLIASKDDTRPVLMNVQVCRAPAGGEHGLLAATDTRRLIVVPCRLDGAPKTFKSVLIPALWLETVHKARPTNAPEIVVTLNDARRSASALLHKGRSHSTSETPLGEGNFPPWLRILDAEFTRKSCPAALDDWHFFSPKQLTEVGLALGTENGDSVSWFQRNPTAPLVVLAPQAGAFRGIALLMPGNPAHEASRSERVSVAERWLFPGRAPQEPAEDLVAPSVTPTEESAPA